MIEDWNSHSECGERDAKASKIRSQRPALAHQL
jgi:hypothetical protein